MKTIVDSRLYSGTPCNECGGPTLVLNAGSIWCPAEDPHPGGHFVSRVAFERSPIKQAAHEARGGRPLPASRGAVAGSRNRMPAPVVVAKPEPVASPFGGGMDDFVSSDES